MRLQQDVYAESQDSPFLISRSFRMWRWSGIIIIILKSGLVYAMGDFPMINVMRRFETRLSLCDDFQKICGEG